MLPDMRFFTIVAHVVFVLQVNIVIKINISGILGLLPYLLPYCFNLSIRIFRQFIPNQRLCVYIDYSENVYLGTLQCSTNRSYTVYRGSSAAFC